jgi:hypothetical protein
MTDDHVGKLRELTEKLPPMASAVVPLVTLVQAIKSSIIEYAVRDGFCFGVGLWKSEDVAVQKAFASKGTTFPVHVHKEHEFIILIKGSYRDNGSEYRAPDVVHYHPDECHSPLFLEDCWMIAITIPPSEGYPNAK